jgi:hypothetical protein
LAWLDGEKWWFLPLLACFWLKTVRLDDLPARLEGSAVRINDLLVRLIRPTVRLGEPAIRIIRPAVWLDQPTMRLETSVMRSIEPAVPITESAVWLAEPTVRLAASAMPVNESTAWLGYSAVRKKIPTVRLEKTGVWRYFLSGRETTSAVWTIRPSALRGCAVAVKHPNVTFFLMACEMHYKAFRRECHYF